MYITENQASTLRDWAFTEIHWSAHTWNEPSEDETVRLAHRVLIACNAFRPSWDEVIPF